MAIHVHVISNFAVIIPVPRQSACRKVFQERYAIGLAGRSNFKGKHESRLEIATPAGSVLIFISTDLYIYMPLKNVKLNFVVESGDATC